LERAAGSWQTRHLPNTADVMEWIVDDTYWILSTPTCHRPPHHDVSPPIFCCYRSHKALNAERIFTDNWRGCHSQPEYRLDTQAHLQNSLARRSQRNPLVSSLFTAILELPYVLPSAIGPKTLKLPKIPQSTQNQKFITNSYVCVYDSPSNLPQTLKLPANPKSTQNQKKSFITVVLNPYFHPKQHHHHYPGSFIRPATDNHHHVKPPPTLHFLILMLTNPTCLAGARLKIWSFSNTSATAKSSLPKKTATTYTHTTLNFLPTSLQKGNGDVNQQ